MAKNASTSSKARAYTGNTIKRLFALSGNKCAFHTDTFECKETIVRDESVDLIIQICHIEGAEPLGQRYNSNSTDDIRRSFENLILLCPNHHIETDNVTKYTVEVLRKMKQGHTSKMLQASTDSGILSKNPAALVLVINQLGVTNTLTEIDEIEINSFDIQEKIDYNNITRYKPIIEEYKIYQGKLNTIFKEIEKDGSNKKDLLLQNIKSLYLREKGNYKSFEELKQNSDNIISAVERGLWKIIEKSNDLNTTIPLEAIEISVLVILVDAFMRCKILEEPTKI